MALKTSIATIISEAKEQYEQPIKRSEHVEHCQKENIERIEAYYYSKFESGETDSQGREKPFFNIVLAAVNIWFRATDISRKNINLLARKIKDVLLVFVARLKLQDFFDNFFDDKEDKRPVFGIFLNNWGRHLAIYGSSLVKCVSVGKNLVFSIVPWNKVIIDQININNGPIIEVLEYSPGNLMKKDGYDKEKAKDILTALETRKEIGDNEQQQDNAQGFIRVYHVTGNLPVALLDDKPEDIDGNDSKWENFTLQFHAVHLFTNKDTKETDIYTLKKGRLNKNPYMLTHLIEEEGRSQGMGAIEYLFQAQWMANFNVKAIKDVVEIISKIIFQTSDEGIAGKNYLDNMMNGQFILHEDGKPVTALNNNKDISQLQTFMQQWENQAKETTSTPDITAGQTLPSATAWRQADIINTNAHGLYEVMIQNKAMYLEMMLRKFILPHLKEEVLNDQEELMATLESHDIEFIDKAFINSETEKLNKKAVIDSLVNGVLPVTVSQADTESAIKEQLETLGNRRAFKPSEISKKTWRQVFEKMIWAPKVEISNENSNKEVALTTLTTALKTIATNPNILQDPKMSFIFHKILTLTNAISPLEISSLPPSPPPEQVVAGKNPDLDNLPEGAEKALATSNKK